MCLPYRRSEPTRRLSLTLHIVPEPLAATLGQQGPIEGRASRNTIRGVLHTIERAETSGEPRAGKVFAAMPQ